MIKRITLFSVIVFLFFSARVNAQEILISQGAVWKYLDNGSDQGTAWRELDFDDSNWASGHAQLGYGDGDEATVVSYGNDPNNKYITTYFRRSFEITDSVPGNMLLVKLLRDDGAVVYLNGVEIVRSNLPTGTITYLTTASTYVAGSEEDTFYEFYAEPSLLQIGTNVVAVEIHQQSGSSSDISFDLQLETTNELPLITRKAPYLIYTGDNTKYQVLWQLRRTETCELSWGTDTTYSLGNVVTTEYGDDHQHTYTFTDLTPGTKYYYKVKIDTLVYKGTFNSAPVDSASSVKFVVYGDNRSYPEDHNAVAEKIIDLYNADNDYQGVILNVGDLVANGDAEEDWDNQLFDPQFEYIQELLRSSGMEVTRGNHEEEGNLLIKYFPYPLGTGHYWSFDYGPAHIVIFDQYIDYSTGSRENTWLKNDLQNTDKPWKFIVLHEPGWSAGGHSNSVDVQNYIQPICEDYNVQIVFGGHNHYYARAVVNNVVHITTGGGGAPLYDPNPSYPNIVTTAKVHHFCKVEINGEQLDFQAIDRNGNEIDAFVISYPNGTDENIAGDVPTEFTLSQNYPNPFNPTTEIKYSVAKNTLVSLKIYDVLGREVAEVVNEIQDPGNYSVTFDASRLTSGVYFYTLRAGNFVTTKKMILLK